MEYIASRDNLQTVAKEVREEGFELSEADTIFIKKFLEEELPGMEEVINGRALVSMIGNSRAGKSTFTNYVLGYKFKREERTYVLEKPENKHAKMGEVYSNNSTTDKTEYYPISDNKKGGVKSCGPR